MAAGTGAQQYAPLGAGEVRRAMVVWGWGVRCVARTCVSLRSTAVLDAAAACPASPRRVGRMARPGPQGRALHLLPLQEGSDELSTEPLAFGFLPCNVVDDLTDLGNWKVRRQTHAPAKKCCGGLRMQMGDPCGALRPSFPTVPLPTTPCALGATVPHPHALRSMQHPAMRRPTMQRRAVAMERLSRSIADATRDGSGRLVRGLPGLTAFLLGLMGDHNFKVAIGGLDALGDVADAVGGGLQSQLR
jgi:hypothetical protein